MKRGQEDQGLALEQSEETEPNRRSALKVLGTGGIVGTLALFGAKLYGLGVTAKKTVSKSTPWQLAGAMVGKQKGAGAASAAVAEALYKLGPGWAAWTQSALNVFDGWSEPDKWMSAIENSHNLPYEHNTFLEVDGSRSPHHWGTMT